MLGTILGIFIFIVLAGAVSLTCWLGYKKREHNDEIYAQQRNEEKKLQNKYEYTSNEPTEEEMQKVASKLAELEKQKKKGLGMWLALGLSVVSLVAFCIVPFSIKRVDATQVAVVKVWGEAQDVRTSGTHFDNYISTSYVYYPINTQEIKEEIQAYSQDAQSMTAQLVVQYKIQADKVINITKEYGDNEMLKSRIQSIAEERAKSVLSKKQAMAIIETRSQLPADILQEMNGAFDNYYVTIVNVVMNDISFSEAFEQAVENKMIAEQEQLKAEYEKQKKITEAEALLEVAKKEAEASIEKSKGDAEALKIMQEAWDSLSADVKQAMLQQMAIEKWNGQMPETLVGTDFLEWLMGIIGSNP